MQDKRPFIIFGIAAILLLVFFFIFSGGEGSSRFDWEESYKQGTNNPYGTSVIYKLLDKYYPGKSISEISSSVYDDLPEKTDKPANYIFVGEGLYMDTSDVNQLLAFVESGNNAFISSKSIPYDLMFYIYYQECDNNFWDDYNLLNDTSVTLNLLHRNLEDSTGAEYKYIVKGRTETYQWHYIDSRFFCEEDYSFIDLGKINGTYVNFARMDYGEGAFYLHTNPLAFTNFQLQDEAGLAYAGKIFSHLEAGPIYWDKYSQIQERVSRRRNRRSNYYQNPERELSTDGPLTYILDQPALRWAWYLLLGTGLLYMIFRAKRKQRIIPVYEGNKNTSLEFISTIGTLYFLQNDHKKLCLQKIKLFHADIRNRYNISTTKEMDEQFVKRLSGRSEIPVIKLERILNFAKNLKKSPYVTEAALTEFHNNLAEYYKTRK